MLIWTCSNGVEADAYMNNFHEYQTEHTYNSEHEHIEKIYEIIVWSQCSL